MSEKRAIFLIDILRNIINIFFDTFFVLYFFSIANYEVLPLAKYFVTLYIFAGISFILIRNPMKANIKVPYFRIGISLQAIYIALILILKERIIDYIYVVGAVKGIANGFFHYPKNILNTEKITNGSRKRYSGIVSAINQTNSIIVPIALGVLLSVYSYTDIGKVVFLLFIVIFIVSFWIKDGNIDSKKFEIKEFYNILKKHKNIRLALIIPLLSGFTYSSGVMGIIVTLLKINVFKTSLNLGIVDSICSVLSLILSLLFAIKVKRYKNLALVSGIFSSLSLVLLAIRPSVMFLIIYLLVRYSSILLINFMSNNIINNLSNIDMLKNRFKPEYYCTHDIAFSLSRCTGYMLLVFVSMFKGINYINYILLIPALSILLEALVISKLATE